MTDSVIPARADWWVPSAATGTAPLAAAPMAAAAAVAAAAPVRRYRPAEMLAWAVVVLIGLSMASSAALTIVVGTSSVGPYDLAWVGSSRWYVALDLLIVRLLLWVAAPIAWFLWFDRVLRNVEPLGGGEPVSSRLGAVAWWFVPIASIWRPARAVGDVYRRLAVPGTPGAWLPAFWWLAWIGATAVPFIFSIVLGLAAGVRRMPLDRVREGVVWLEWIGDGLEIAAGALAITMVIAIQRAQAARANAMRMQAATTPTWAPAGPAGPAGPVPATLSARPGSLPARSLIVAGVVITFGLLASAVLAQGRPTPTTPQGPAGAASPTPMLAVPSPSPSPTARPDARADWTVADRLQSNVLDRGSGYSARIALDGSMRLRDARVEVRGDIEGSIAVSGSDFRSRARISSSFAEVRSDESVAMVGGRIYVREGNGPWTTATVLPDTFAIDPFHDLIWSHDLDELGPGEGGERDLTRIRWPMAEASLVAGLTQYLDTSFAPSMVSAVILASADGTPVRVELEIRGSYRDAGSKVNVNVALRYRYSDFGQPIVVEAPDIGR